jgi:hypothetical protein
MRIGRFTLPLVCMLVSCGPLIQGVPPRNFPSLGHVTRISVVGSDASKPLVMITDPKKISRIVMFVDSHRKGWEAPRYGIPVPAVTAEFFDGTEFKGHFGAGRGFFETQREGVFRSQDASPAEVHRFLALLGVDGPISSANSR